MRRKSSRPKMRRGPVLARKFRQHVEALEPRCLLAADIALSSVAYDWGTSTWHVDYGISVSPEPAVDNFTIALVRSSDGTAVGEVHLVDSGDLNPGTHTVELPVELNDVEEDYYLTAVADTNNENEETDETNNRAVYSGTFLTTAPEGDVVHVHGTSAVDSVTIATANGMVDVTFNGAPLQFAAEDLAAVHVRTHQGNDTIDAANAALPVWLFGGPGADSLTGGSASDVLQGEGAAAPAAVVGRHVFYNNSFWDGNDPSAGASDDGAVAPDKAALLPGQTAALVNYTSFNQGINGLIVDVDSLPADGARLSAVDFLFKTGNNSTPAGWPALATAPTVSVRPGAGTGGSDRVTLIWPSGTIAKKWLEVNMLATPNTGLAADDVFYFGNAVGEGGDSAVDFSVTVADELLARDNPRNLANPAPIDFLYDYNRDRLVNVTDQLIARNNKTNLATRLQIITPPALNLSGDLLAGGAGADRLEGGLGDDTLTGGADEDWYVFAGSRPLGSDHVVELAGEQYDTLDFMDLAQGVTLNLAVATQQVANPLLSLTMDNAALEFVQGTQFVDVLTGNAANNALYGNGGDDVLAGGDGSDALFGGLGNDTLDGQQGSDAYAFIGDAPLGSDVVNDTGGSQDADALDFSGLTEPVTADLSQMAPNLAVETALVHLTLTSTTIEDITGTPFDDVLIGNGLNNHLAGGEGDDTYNFAGVANLGGDFIVEGPAGGINLLNIYGLTIEPVHVDYTIVGQPQVVSPGVLTLTLTDDGQWQNWGPTANEMAGFTLAEDSSDSFDLGSVFDDMEDLDGQLTYELITYNHDDIISASISGQSLNVIAAANQFGYSEVTIRATDVWDYSVEATVVVVVTPANDAPTGGAIGNVTVTDTAADSVIDLWAAFNDAEDGPYLTFEVVGNTNAAIFDSVTIDPANGLLRLSYAGILGSSQISIRAHDSAGAYTPANVTFTVTVSGVAKPTVRVQNIRSATESGEQGFFRVERIDPHPQLPLTVAYAQQVSTPPSQTEAQVDIDYNGIPAGGGQLSFASGELSKDIPITAIADGLTEPFESLTLAILPAPPGSREYQLGSTLSIIDMDRRKLDVPGTTPG